MVMFRTPAARLRPLMLAAFWLLALVSACDRFIEPPQDTRLVAALDALAQDTEALFADFAATATEARAERYAALAAEAHAITVRAELRASAQAVQPEPGPYAIATVGFMADYSRNLDYLAKADAAAGAYGLLPQIVALRHAAMADAVRDALVYERDLLARFP
jgi:hypothetical protein